MDGRLPRPICLAIIIVCMRTFTSKEYQYAFLALPQHVRDLICSIEIDEKMRAVAKQFALDDPQTETYRTIMAQCLYGLLSMAELPAYLSSELNIPDPRARELIEVSKEAFLNTLQSTQDPATPTSPQPTLAHDLSPSGEHRHETDTNAVSVHEDAARQPRDDSQKTNDTANATNPFSSASPLEQFIRKDAAVSERYAKLPEEVRTAIISPEVANAFSSTIRSYDVSQEGFMALGAETARLLVGLVSTNDFRTRVRERSIVPPERYENFVRELEGTVVKPVQQAIMAVLANRKSASA